MKHFKKKMVNNFQHIPVLLEEVIDGLKVSAGNKYIDGTIGGGGHSLEILKRGGIVLGIDQDPDAVEAVSKKLEKEIKSGQLKVVSGNFSEIKDLASGNGFGQVDGILLDLGVSSYQLDNSGRGFSIRHDEKLDMRMDKNGTLSAYEVVNKYPFERLVDIFYRYGEEHNSKGVAQAILDKRKNSPIETTGQLADLITRLPHKSEAIHPATRAFQAIRIEVNNEIEVLKKALDQGCELLNSNGRLVVISFHSLEDRIVKQVYGKMGREGYGEVMTKKPLIATDNEVEKNKRARSAKLRIFKKK